MNEKVTKKERQELLTLLQNHSNLRTGQDQVLWSIFGAFWTANSLLLVSIFNSSNQWNKFLVAFIVSLIGIAISWVWNHIQNRALLRIEKYEDSIIFIEKRLEIRTELCSFFVQGTNHNEERRKKGTARHVMKQFSKYAMYVWLLSSIIFFTLLIIHICCPSFNLSYLVLSAKN